MDTAALFGRVFLRYFFLLGPFAVVSAFLTLTRELGQRERRRTAVRSTLAIVVICFALWLIGNQLFAVLGITLDAFRIGAGALLFLSGAQLVQGRDRHEALSARGEIRRGEPADGQDVAVVPLAIPIVVGPATTGALLVMGAELHGWTQQVAGAAALLAAILVVGAVFLLGSRIERALGPRGLAILTKLTGLFLASLAAQMIFTGIRNFLSLPAPARG